MSASYLYFRDTGNRAGMVARFVAKFGQQPKEIKSAPGGYIAVGPVPEKKK